ncbi:DDE superfamily endonuclease [Nitzschia inconspicua]|uniref:DDE superfamily endonuclease n=1 Tax=Nitzschia inconspicua TaxID=303405 RepID=A0A9K3KQ58_9STRA|nr:DDE superfamily endonuclease [Nitzschia inconspicua]KAG7337601.1 DDE superfamily endonuclease [Nitzschia inconspicua]KAG7343841.1 DDE superfamily endonuclease [Nitzschia inconspicua]KAG7347100.1 DDE superfamily endonuclease [Nitzschia inconspicua]KAG7362648.1 DDE superfamily endonuclease [Nitzschia inconspicua]
MSCLAVDENEFLQLLIAFDEMSSSSSDEEEQKERPRKRPFKHRKSKGVVMFRDDNGELKVLPPTMSLWYNMYCQTGCQERMSDFHSKFRRRFRLPYDQYRELVEMCTADSMKEDGTSLFKRWRPGKKAALTGKPAAPLELLVLTTLRYLGRGWTFDDLEECTAISEEVIRVFFHQFIKFGSTTLYNKYVGPPLTVEDAIDLCIREYEAAGFPGCVGSMDASHVEHQRISFKHRQAHLSFKLPFTSRTYNIVTSHRRKIFSTTDGHPARWNDKTLVRYDDMASTLHDGTNPLCNLIFELYAYDENNLIIKERYKGGWLIVDNGYLNWGVTIPPMKDTDTRAQYRFSKWLESMRKDVECTFGILKGRWRVLKSGIRVHGTDKSDMMWKTCCALHNWLLEIDGLDKDYTSDWEGELGELNATDLPNAVRTLLSNTNPSARSYAGRAVDEEDYFQGSLVRDEDGAIIVRHMNMTDFRQRLITHFDIAFKKKEIIWPKARLQMDEPYANVQP